MISAIILTKNEEKNIGRCIKSLDFCDEILVIDDWSSDSTRKISRKLGAKVYRRRIDKDMSKQLNFGASKARGEWILFMNADEVISPALRKEILQETKSEDYSGYYFKRHDFLWGKWLTHGEIGSLRILRLVKRGSGVWKRRVHEYFEIEGKTRILKNPILHYPHPALREFLDSVRRWSEWHYLANREEDKKSNVVKIIFFPLFKFFQNYFLRFGFLDGVQGFILAVVMSFHSFLSWSELWLAQRKR